MNSLAQGDRASDIEVSNISTHGFWMKIRGREHFMSYEDFPCFKGQAAGAIEHVVEVSQGNFRWPDINIDLTQAAIELPEPIPFGAELAEQVC
jgi:hypothetical protein